MQPGMRWHLSGFRDAPDPHRRGNSWGSLAPRVRGKRWAARDGRPLGLATPPLCSDRGACSSELLECASSGAWHSSVPVVRGAAASCATGASPARP